MATRIIPSRLANKAIVCLRRVNVQTRSLSSQGSLAMERLRGALEEYRTLNYTQECPSRFKKEIVRAAKKDDTNTIAVDGMQRVISNIDMEHKVSKEDMELIFREVGETNGTISADRFMKMF